MRPAPRLGIDIGGTKTAVTLVGSDGVVLEQRTAPSGRGPVRVVDVAVSLANDVASAAGGLGAIASVGACMPGLVDPSSGLVRYAVNLDVTSLDLRGELERHLGVRVAVENDVKAAALGAWRWLGVRGPAGPRADAYGEPRADASRDALAYLNLGTGLASAVVREGRVVRGIAGAAGEIGHLPVGGDAPCTCGQVGCLETVASGSALARLWPEGAGRRRDPFVAAAWGDRAARAAVDVLASGVGLAIQLLAHASGAGHVVVGGGLSRLGVPLHEAVRADLERRGRASQVVAALGLPDRFELLPESVPVAALGAALLEPMARRVDIAGVPVGPPSEAPGSAGGVAADEGAVEPAGGTESVSTPGDAAARREGVG